MTAQAAGQVGPSEQWRGGSHGLSARGCFAGSGDRRHLSGSSWTWEGDAGNTPGKMPTSEAVVRSALFSGLGLQPL